MKELTPQQEKFARLVAEGKNQSEAYILAFPNAQQWKPTSVAVAGSKLMALDNVSQMVDALRAEVSKKTVETVDDHLNELKRLRDIALENGKYGDAITAEVNRGKVRGFYVNKTEDVTDPVKKAMGRMKPEEAVSALEALRQIKTIREKAKQDA